MAATASIESALLVHRKTHLTAQTLDLSENQLRTCSSRRCSGGFAEEAFEYVLQNGIAYEEDYRRESIRNWGYDSPYGSCYESTVKKIYPLKGYCVKTFRDQVGRKAHSDRTIQQHLLKFGPLYMATSTWYYQSEYYLRDNILDDPGCTARGYLNHAVLLVGYDEQSWILKNSFDDDYADNGYYRIARGDKNICGINTEIAFPLV